MLIIQIVILMVGIGSYRKLSSFCCNEVFFWDFTYHKTKLS